MRRAIFAVVSLSPALAFAEGFALDRYHAPPSVEDGLARERPDTLGHLRWSGALAVDYANAPLVLAQGGEPVANVVSHQATLHLSGALGIFDRFQFGLELPVTGFQSGEDPGVTVYRGETPVRAEVFEAPGTAALGDPVLGASVLALGERTGPQLGVGLAFPLPVGSQDDLASDGGFGMRIRTDGAIVLPGGSAGVGLGFARRPRRAYEVGVLETGNEITFDGGAYFSVVGGVEAAIEILGATEFREAFASDETAIEALAGARLALPLGLVVGAGAGPGITRAVGVPAFRALVTVGFAPPRPPEVARRTRPSPEEEDILGPAAPDRDADGLPDDRDQCPSDAESTNGVDDEDGCPDTVRLEDDRVRLIGGIAFERGTDAPTAESVQVLEELAALLQAHPEVRSVRIVGHGDAQDGSRRDLDLARRRARAVQNRLVELGVDAGRTATTAERGSPRRGGGYIEILVEGP